MEINEAIDRAKTMKNCEASCYDACYTCRKPCVDAEENYNALVTLQTENTDLRAELERTKRERDAAVRDIYSMAACDICKHYDANDNICTKPMVESYKCFEWRGVQADTQA